jgi:hypothetical protein
VAACWRRVAIPGVPLTPSVWGTPPTAWPAVRESGGTPPGGHGDAWEPRGGGVRNPPVGPQSTGRGAGGARRPLAGGVVGRAPRPQAVASAGAQGTHGLCGRAVGCGASVRCGSPYPGVRIGRVPRPGRSWAPARALDPRAVCLPCPRRGVSHVPSVSGGVSCPCWGWGGAVGPAGGGCQLRWSPGQSGGQAVAWGAAGVAARAGPPRQEAQGMSQSGAWCPSRP